VLDVHPRFGRAFEAAEDLKAGEPVAMLSAAAFRSRFASDPSVVGRSITLDGQPRRIVGVLPEGFSYDGPHDVFVPFAFTPAQLHEQRGAHYLEVVGKLRPGISLAAAEQGIRDLAARIRPAHPEEYPPEQGFSLSLRPLRDRFVSGSRQAIVVLFGAATWRICCWPDPPCGTASSPSGQRSARHARGSSASC
jgi:putative ABC transport system permease protein